MARHEGDDEDSSTGGADAEFRAAIGPVRRLPDAAEPPRAPRRQATASMRTSDERAALAETMRADPARDAEILGDAVSWRRDEVSPEILRRLKQGQFAVEDEIDLHHLGERAAEDLLRRFLAEVRDAGHHCVRIVHGKGLHSTQGPVLKGMVERVLALRADVLAYASSPPAQGGTGAVLALLAPRKPRQGPGRTA